jgi:hypothetical protein
MRHRPGTLWNGRTYRWIFPVIAIALGACSTTGVYTVPGTQPQTTYSHRVATPDVELYWNCKESAPGVLQIEGAVHNFGGRTVRFFQIEADGTNAQGQYVSQAVTSLPDIKLEINQVSQFKLTLHSPEPMGRVDFSYMYRAGGFHSFSGFPEEEHHFFVRDACGSSQHVAP